jgi:hypothetical protein
MSVTDQEGVGRMEILHLGTRWWWLALLSGQLTRGFLSPVRIG